MSDLTCEQYLQVRSQDWQRQGFDPLPASTEAETVFRRRRFSLTKFGVVDTFCIARCFEDILSEGQIETFSSNAFRFALKNKFFLPRGLGGMAIAYPLLIAENVSNSVRQFITRSYNPKHWSSFEFPVVFELSTGQLLFYQSTPAWGAAYYRSFRTEAETLFTHRLASGG